jgi:hypothetical protein
MGFLFVHNRVRLKENLSLNAINIAKYKFLYSLNSW